MKFQQVAQSFDQIESVSSRNAITELLGELFKKASPQEAAIIAYLSMGNLNPVYVGTQFNMADKSLYKILGKLLDMEPELVKEQAKSKGDLGLIAQKTSDNGDEGLSVEEVNLMLHKVHDISGVGSQEKKEEVLLELLRKLDPVSCKYIVRIIVGKLRLGFSDMTLIDAFSWMKMGDKSLRPSLEDAYNVSADIGHLIKVLKEDGIKAIEKMSVEVGIPLRPAAAERSPSAASIVKRLGHCVAQPKIDGFRLQVHVNKADKEDKVHFYSRNLQDMSEMFPDLKEAVLDLNIETLVAEGEAIAYDAETDTFLPFQETVKRKRKHNIAEVAAEFPLKLYLFDILYINGRTMLDETHAERRRVLLDLFGNKGEKELAQELVLPIEEKEINTAEELEEYFEENISSGLEGLLVKKIDATYKAGKRNFNWIKLKREESGHLDDTIDCVILGYYLGRGKRVHFGIGAFLVGVYNKVNDTFETIAKIGTGLKDEDWKELKKKCDAIATQSKPNNVECSKELYPDVWVEPKLVCAIRADEITHSPLHMAGKTKHKLGLALRFPRIMSYREDKSASDATTVVEVERLCEIQFDKTKKGTKRK